MNGRTVLVACAIAIAGLAGVGEVVPEMGLWSNAEAARCTVEIAYPTAIEVRAECKGGWE